MWVIDIAFNDNLYGIDMKLKKNNNKEKMFDNIPNL